MVIRDDGTQFRNLPWGRDGNEFCQGHQCWRGGSTWAITSTSTRQPAEAQLIESRVVSHTGHDGLKTPGGIRNDLSRVFPKPQFYHFATDLSGTRLITDAAPLDKGGRLFVAELGPLGGALVPASRTSSPRCVWTKPASRGREGRQSV